MVDKAVDSLDRIVPANINAEQMLLGAIMINSSLVEQVNEFLLPVHFYEALHQKIYHAINILTEKGLAASPITLKSMLEQEELYKQAGGGDYLVKLTTLAMVVINPYEYGIIIYELALKRNLIDIGQNIVNSAYGSTLEQSAMQQIESAEVKLYNLATSGLVEKSFTPMTTTVATSIASINRAMKNADHVTGISTGLIDIDNKLSGFQNSDLIIVAGRPSMGKTAFAINFAFNACKALARRHKDADKVPAVGFFSLEMSAEQLTTRLLSMIAQVDSAQLRTGQISEESYNKLRQAGQQLEQMPFFIDDTPALSISAIRARARKLKRKHGLGILFIDYLQLLKGVHNADNRTLEISEITQGLKALAKDLNIPVIALSQLSRAVEQREDKRPMLSDLRESGSIEQDADVVMFLYREEYYLQRKPLTPDSEKFAEWQAKATKMHNIAEIIIAKHRNGAVGKADLLYIDKFSTVGNLSKEQKPN